MGRWEPDAAGRLRVAAMELFAERGYEQTTVADIAGRAGLTPRTFFRYFTDKREVLFQGSAELTERVVAATAAAPPEAAPMAAVDAGLAEAVAMLGERHAYSRARYAVIDANAELREREAAKMATLASDLAVALRDRGVDEPDATLAAETGIAVFRVAFERWVSDPVDRGFGETMRECRARLGRLSAPA